MAEFTTFDGPVWRIMAKAAMADPMSPARAMEGRFHYDRQVAVYTSLSSEGAQVAIKRYLNDGLERVMVPLSLSSDRVIDQRGNPHASIVWQEIREAGEFSPTWTISDDARRGGAEAMLYSSRSRPDLSHMVVFMPDRLRYVGPVTPAFNE